MVKKYTRQGGSGFSFFLFEVAIRGASLIFWCYKTHLKPLKMNKDDAMKAFVDLKNSVDKHDVADFMIWIQRSFFMAVCSGDRPAKQHASLRNISQDLREMVPISGVLPSEKFVKPEGENSDCDPRHTVPVDSFMYESYDLDDMAREGKFSKHYCKDCHSHNCDYLTFTSHSSSIRRVEFLMRTLLGYSNTKDKTIVDVGSRLGAMVFGAYVNTEAKKIIGIEINEELCKIQQKIVDKYEMGNRVQIICNDVLNCAEVLQAADVVVLNNPFEFFLPPADQEKIWKFLRATLTKKGTIIVTVPSLEKALSHLNTGIDIGSWVEVVPIVDHRTALYYRENAEMSEMVVYEVK